MKKSIKIIIITMIFIAISICNVCAADDACKVTLSSDKTKINVGDTVSVKINLSNIKDVAVGITQIAGQIEYSQDVFEIEYIEDSEIEEEVELDSLREKYEVDNLKIAYYDDEGWCLLLGEVEGADGALLIGETVGDPVESSKTICSIKFKAKEETDSAEVIKISSLSVFDSEETKYDLTSESSINITVSKEEKIEDSSNKQQNNTQNTQNTKKENTLANESTPYTGVKEITPIILIAAIVTIAGLIGIIKYKEVG